ncbi:MAG: DNA helicase, partial [Oscillospiraceae bacterium]
MGGDNEQYSSFGRGNSSKRPDLLLNCKLPSVEEQQNLIEKAEMSNASAFVVSQEEIDLVLQRGSGVQDGKYRIYEQFLKQKSQAENADFLKEEYGWGGSYPAVINTDLDEGHDGKGIKISKGSITKPDAEILLPWAKVAKRIGELISADRYLNDKEKSHYPIYLSEKQEQGKRFEVGKEFNNIIREYNEYMNGLEEHDKTLNQYVLTDCGSCFARSEKKTGFLSMRGDYILPLMETALQTIISENTPLADRAKAMQEILNSDMAIPVLPEPELEYEYQYHLGDKVYIGANEYEILSFDDTEVRLFDNSFPLLNKVFERSDFDEKVEENPHNEHLKVIVEEKTEPQQTEENPGPYAQYLEIKDEYPIDIVTVEVGDFYEFYLEDAKIATDIIGLHLTTRVIDGEYVSMCGIPRHKLKEYTQKILDEGHNLVIHGRDVNGEISSRKILSTHKYDKPQEVETNITTMPVEDYREIMAIQNGFDSYEDMRSQGVKFKNEYDTDFVPEVAEQNPNDDLIGKEITIDNRKYAVENATLYGEVVMRDITFEGAVGFPINRAEKAEYIRKLLAEKEKQDITPLFDKKPKSAVKTFDLHPEIKGAERNQYSISNNDLGVGSSKEKFRANIDAINLLKELEFENRLATPQEQEILAGYVGWGGLSDAFDQRDAGSDSRYARLKQTLPPEEYSAARESTLTAFYTPPIVIKSMYKALESMGFSKGNILEPSCGTGNFIGMLPDSMQDSKVYGVELDNLTGKIAQHLYQKSSIAVQGYENTNLPDSFFDVAIGNVPFGQFKVADKKYDKQKWLIHDYFFGKTLDKVRPGGVIAFITSKGTMDKENPAVRKYIAQRADLLGAIRLPNNTFKANAGTEVTSDIIFLQKRDRIIDIEADWVHLGKDENGLTMNRYFIDNPEMIMGEMKEISGPYGPETACIAYDDQSLDDLLDDAINNIHAEIEDYEVDYAEGDIGSGVTLAADPNVRNFSYVLVDGDIYFRENSRMTLVDVSATAQSRIKGMITIRDCVRNLIELQTEDYPDSEITAKQNKLNRLYDVFTKTYGLIGSRANSTAFSNDSSYCLLASLEIIDENGELERKADMFSKRTIKPHTPVTSVDTASEALAVSLSEKANLDMP